jgi:hypothetical protein
MAFLSHEKVLEERCVQPPEWTRPFEDLQHSETCCCVQEIEETSVLELYSRVVDAA